jgi:ribosomal-protein-alanine N-acetyltransferase
MLKVAIRKQRVTDAKRFYEILNNPNFVYFRICPKSVEAEREILQKNIKENKDNAGYHYSILYGGKHVGGCGIKIDQQRK